MFRCIETSAPKKHLLGETPNKIPQFGETKEEKLQDCDSLQSFPGITIEFAVLVSLYESRSRPLQLPRLGQFPIETTQTGTVSETGAVFLKTVAVLGVFSLKL